MEVASQGRVGPEGGGEATVFDTSGFYDQMYNIQKDIIAERKKKQEEAKRQQQTWNALLEDPGDVWQSDFEYVNKAVEEYNKFIIDDLRANGIDPNNMSPELTRKLKALEANIRRTTAAAKDNETYYNQSFNILNQDKANKYNKDHAANWLREYADPAKSPQDRAKLRTESNPFKINYNMIEFIDDTIPKEEVVDKGRLKITSRNKEAHRGLVLDFIMNDPSGQDVFESLKKPVEDEIAFAERVATEGQKRYPAKEDRQVTPTSSDNKRDDKFEGGYGTGNWNGKLSMAYQKDPNFANVSTNKISITRTGTNDNLPFISVKDDSGILIDFQPSSFYLRSDGKISVEGFKKNIDGDPEPAWVSYDLNKDMFKSQALGYDVEEEFNRIKGGGASSGTTSGSQTKETPAQRAARIAAGG